MTHNYDRVAGLVAASVERTKGPITAKRLLPVATAAGYGGSARNVRRLVAEAKASWRAKNRRGAEAATAALAECFEAFGEVPRVALTDRMGCLKGGTVAGVVTDPGLCAVPDALRVPARLLRRRRRRVEGVGN